MVDIRKELDAATLALQKAEEEERKKIEAIRKAQEKASEIGKEVKK